MRIYDPAGHDPGTNQGLLSQLVVPRPIALVSTRSPDGVGNVAPFSYYLPITGDPPLVGIAFGRRASDFATKHSFDNLIAAGDFVINVCSPQFADIIEDLAKEYPQETDEAEEHGLTLVPSEKVTSPGVGEATARIECVVHQTIDLGGERAPITLVVGEMVCAVLDEAILESPDLDHPRIDLVALGPIGRTGARTFARMVPDAIYYQERVPYAADAPDLPDFENL
jgi:flavin reductase (DIM6/NTAB) family NADH-FMN oxidoreductase RutF